MTALIKKAFTLIELLVVIAIIGILSGLIVVSMSGVTTKANIAKAQVFSNSLRNSLLLDLVSEWKLDEGTGATSVDSWSGGNNFTLLDGNGACSTTLCPQWQTTNCIYGNCLSFNGTGAYAEISGSSATTSNLAITGAITLSVWVKFGDLGTDRSIIGRGQPWAGNTNSGYYLGRYNTDNKVDFYTYSTTTGDRLRTTNGITDTNWHFIVATWDGTTNTNGKKIYVDGVLSNQATSTIAAIGQPSYTFRIGRGSTTNYYFIGSIDEARIFNNVITSSEIEEQYYAGINHLLISKQITNEEYQNRLVGIK